MAFYEIPTRDDLNNYEFSIILNEEIYYFHIYYNDRMDRYLLNILDSAKEQLVTGLPILTDVVLTDYLKYLEIPQGDIIASGEDNNAGYELLGNEVRLYYND